MSKTIQNRYNPDYISPPGETLQEILEEKGMTQDELAKRIGKTKAIINEIISDKAAITPDIALQLEMVLGIPASFWNNRDRQYQEFLARQSRKRKLLSSS